MYLFIPCTKGPNIFSIHIFILLNSQEIFSKVLINDCERIQKAVFRKYIVRPYFTSLINKHVSLFFSRIKFHPTRLLTQWKIYSIITTQYYLNNLYTVKSRAVARLGQQHVSVSSTPPKGQKFKQQHVLVSSNNILSNLICIFLC